MPQQVVPGSLLTGLGSKRFALLIILPGCRETYHEIGAVDGSRPEKPHCALALPNRLCTQTEDDIGKWFLEIHRVVSFHSDAISALGLDEDRELSNLSHGGLRP